MGNGGPQGERESARAHAAPSSGDRHDDDTLGPPRLLAAIRDLAPHDHLCLIYETRVEQLAAVVPFIRLGLEAGDRCVYIADADSADTVVATLRDGGVDTAGAITTGALSVVTQKDTYLRDGVFDPDAMIAYLDEQVALARQDGYRALRATGEMTWALGDVPGAERLIEYEAKLNTFFPQRACLAVCQYDRSRFPAEIIHDVIATHPVVVYGGDVYQNPYFIPPSQFLGEGRAEREVARELRVLQDQRRREEAALARVAALEQRYRALVERMDACVAVYEAVDDGADFVFVDVNPALERTEGVHRDDLLGRRVTEVFPGVRAMGLFDVSERVWRSGEAEHHPVSLYQDERRAGWRENEVYRLPTGEVVAAYQDVTRLREFDQALRDSERRYREMVERAPVGMFRAGADGVVEMANPALARMFGFTTPEALLTEVTSLDDWYVDRGARDEFIAAVRRDGEVRNVELEHRRTDGGTGWMLVSARTVVADEPGAPTIGGGTAPPQPALCVEGFARDITERKLAETALRRIEWMLTTDEGAASRALEEAATLQPYGDLTELDTQRTILDAVGPGLLGDIVRDYLDLLGTSSAVYEVNGDYAYGIFSSGWCRLMDAASRRLAGDVDNASALAGGLWHCHEACWKDAALQSIERREPVDVECAAGLRLYAVPIMVGDEVVGSINFGYGDPPTDDETLAALAGKFQVEVDELRRAAAGYESRPPFIVDLARRRLRASAALIAEMVARKRVEEDLRESEARAAFWAHVVETSSQPLAIGYPDGRLGLANQAFADLTGYSVDELRTMDWATQLTPPEWLPAERETLAELERTGRPVRYEKEYLRKDGSRVPIELLVHLVRDDDGRPLHYYGFVTDITERRRAEAHIQALNADLDRRVRERTAELEAAVGELEAFNYSVSHDLRAPLRGIDGFAEVLLQEHGGQLDEEGRHCLERVRAGAQKMGALIDDLLLLSRLGRRGVRREPVDLSGEAGAVATALRQAEPERSVTVTVQPDLTVSADATMLRVLLDNVIGNAWKFTSRVDDARIEVGAVELSDGKAFYVRDNGVGFDMAFAGKLFEPFQGLHDEKDYPGTGVGLATVRRIVQRHDGSVWAESRPGEGTTVFFRL